MTADLNVPIWQALLESDLAAGILAVADLREQRAKAWPSKSFTTEAGPGCYDYRGHVLSMHVQTGAGLVRLPGDHSKQVVQQHAEHIAAEANPAHVLAEVALWRAIVRGHDHGRYICEDIAAVRDAVIAYLGGES